MTALTEVELTHLPGRVERWLRFGRYTSERIVDRRRRVLGFVVGEVFAFVRWASNEHGTIVSRLDILRTVGVGEACTAVPCVTPGAEILLRVWGWPRVQRVLELIDRAELVVTDAADVCPDYWGHVHQRLAVGDTPGDYDAARHRAWLLRRRVET